MTVWVKEHKRSMTAREYRIRNITLSLFISRSPYLLRDLCIFLIRRNMFDQPILQSPELSARYIWHQSRQLHMHRTPPPTHNSYCNPVSTSRCGSGIRIHLQRHRQQLHNSYCNRHRTATVVVWEYFASASDMPQIPRNSKRTSVWYLMRMVLELFVLKVAWFGVFRLYWMQTCRWKIRLVARQRARSAM